MAASQQSSCIRISANILSGDIPVSIEHKLNSNNSLQVKAGPTIGFGKGGVEGGKSRWTFHAFGSVEVRHYLNFARRLRKNKSIEYFSGTYISLEPFIQSNSLASINDSNRKTGGQFTTYINLGFQKQYNGIFFIGGAIGYTPITHSFSKPIPKELSPVKLNFLLGIKL